jgi:hypothetical protein
MKKIFTIFLALTIHLSMVMCQTPVITMTTSNAVGSTITFDLATNPASTVQVDFGDGIFVTKNILTSRTTISGTLVGTQTVKVCGAGITLIDCNEQNLTALDVTKNITLATLNCNLNQLSSLDVSKNIALTTLGCNNNKLTFATLPLKQASWTNYYYGSQAPYFFC